MPLQQGPHEAEKQRPKTKPHDFMQLAKVIAAHKTFFVRLQKGKVSNWFSCTANERKYEKYGKKEEKKWQWLTHRHFQNTFSSVALVLPRKKEEEIDWKCWKCADKAATLGSEPCQRRLPFVAPPSPPYIWKVFYCPRRQTPLPVKCNVCSPWKRKKKYMKHTHTHTHTPYPVLSPKLIY